jgi:cytochrome c5
MASFLDAGQEVVSENVVPLVMVSWKSGIIGFRRKRLRVCGDNGRVEVGFVLAVRAKRLIWAVGLALALTVAPPAVDAQSGRSGKDVVDSVCHACHGTGAQGAPRIGDRKAWSKRASQGLSSLTQHALTGIRQMPAHGGDPSLTDLEIGRAITYMVNQSGGRWIEPSAKDLSAERSGGEIVQAQCAKCHQTGEGGAPRIGDRGAWIPRLDRGLDNAVRSAIRGHGGMPPRGDQADLTDAEVRSAIVYMFSAGIEAQGTPQQAGSAKKAAAATKTDAKHASIGGIDIYLGLVPAETVRAYPKASVERAMHGGVPSGAGHYHVNVSLFDGASHAPISDARVDVRIERRGGVGSESKTLEPMAISNAPSYGNYVRMAGKASYVITVWVQRSQPSVPIEARFEHTTY